MEQYIVHIEQQAGSALQNQEQGLAQHFDSELHQARIELQAITDAQQGQVQAAQDALAARTTQAELADQQAHSHIEQLTLALHALESKNQAQEQQMLQMQSQHQLALQAPPAVPSSAHQDSAQVSALQHQVEQLTEQMLSLIHIRRCRRRG